MILESPVRGKRARRVWRGPVRKRSSNVTFAGWLPYGEVREMCLSGQPNPQTRYFFAARLKYSRFMYVSFQQDMREETFLRCLIACFVAMGGVPWVVVTDNMKTAVVGRDLFNQPVFNPAYQKLAAEFTFLPEACAPASGNQKGSVENLVKFVKQNFLPGRSFHDDADLAEQCQHWLMLVNCERESDATGELLARLLLEEQRKFGPLPAQAADYGFFDCVVVSREGLVSIESNRYSVPAHLVGRALTARLHQDRIELFADTGLVATHPRSRLHNERIVDPAHFEAVFLRKPRARIMVYRDWLCKLSPLVSHYVRELCYKRRAEMSQQISLLYETAQERPRADWSSCAGSGGGTADVRRRICESASALSPPVCARPDRRKVQSAFLIPRHPPRKRWSVNVKGIMSRPLREN